MNFTNFSSHSCRSYTAAKGANRFRQPISRRMAAFPSEFDEPLMTAPWNGLASGLGQKRGSKKGTHLNFAVIRCVPFFCFVRAEITMGEGPSLLWVIIPLIGTLAVVAGLIFVGWLVIRILLRAAY